MYLKYTNVNYAFYGLVHLFHHGLIGLNKTESRNGNVLRVNTPITVCYKNPRQRVLFSPARDCNPFFHLYEALWMLAGRNYVGPLLYYNSKMADYSDDGETLHGAYGYRWGYYFGYNQLDMIIGELQANPSSRRAVLSMWNPMECTGRTSDLFMAVNGGKDVPCNTHAYLDIVDGKLNMTVCNRSNDMIWGMLGANVVHFSMLQEYIANCVGVEVGVYNQFTNNLHVYEWNWTPEKFINETHTVSYAYNVEDQTVYGGVLPGFNLVKNKEKFDYEVEVFVTDPFRDWSEPFLNTVAKPMCQAFKHHKARQYDLASEAIDRVTADDWRIAGKMWIERRRINWENKSNEQSNNPYHVSAQRQASKDKS